MDITAYEQARAEQYAKTAVWLAMWSGMSVSLLLFCLIVVSQIAYEGRFFLLILTSTLSSPTGLVLNLIALILNLVALILGFLGRRTNDGKRAMRLVGLFWANLIACALIFCL